MITLKQALQVLPLKDNEILTLVFEKNKEVLFNIKEIKDKYDLKRTFVRKIELEFYGDYICGGSEFGGFILVLKNDVKPPKDKNIFYSNHCY